MSRLLNYWELSVSCLGRCSGTTDRARAVAFLRRAGPGDKEGRTSLAAQSLLPMAGRRKRRPAAAGARPAAGGGRALLR